jgi:hypothetical protein
MYVSDAIYLMWHQNNSDWRRQKISLDGERLWGDSGVGSTDQLCFYVSSPSLTLINESLLAAGWIDNNGFDACMKISYFNTNTGLGNEMGWNVTNPPAQYDNLHFVNADNNHVFVLWSANYGSSSNPTKGIYAQCLDFSGVANNDPVALPTVSLSANYPNPFNPETTIEFNLAKAGKACLQVFNLKGQKVATLVNKNLTAGKHAFQWQGKNENDKPVASGVYFYKLTAGDKTLTRKMILMK